MFSLAELLVSLTWYIVIVMWWNLCGHVQTNAIFIPLPSHLSSDCLGLDAMTRPLCNMSYLQIRSVYFMAVNYIVHNGLLCHGFMTLVLYVVVNVEHNKIKYMWNNLFRSLDLLKTCWIMHKSTIVGIYMQ